MRTHKHQNTIITFHHSFNLWLLVALGKKAHENVQLNQKWSIVTFGSSPSFDLGKICKQLGNISTYNAMRFLGKGRRNPAQWEFTTWIIFFYHFSGSARRKLTCTICNRKCSSSLNLQEHRKVRLVHPPRCRSVNPSHIFCTGSGRVFTARPVLHDPFLQCCLFGAVSRTCHVVLSHILLCFTRFCVQLSPLYDQIVANVFWVTQSTGMGSFSRAHSWEI